MEFDYKNILIFGYSKSGRAVEEILKDIKVEYKIYDKTIKINGGRYLSKINAKYLKQFDLIVLSPGVSIYNKKIQLAERLGIKVVSELEFGFWFTNAKIIAVTGTNGKTTTTTLINNVLQLAGYKSDAYGNIGKPLSLAYKKELDYIVCEVSSFQLESTDKFVADIGILLNISPDHIDRHITYQNYIDCKLNLFKNCCSINHVVIGNNLRDCDNIINNVTGNVIKFGTNNEDIVAKDNVVFVNNNRVCEINKKMLNYTYIDNILAVISVLYLLKIDYNLINEIKINNKIEHRVEPFLKHGGVTYINDSKATNPDATIKAIETIKGDIVLLLGGSDKNLSFVELIKWLPNNVKFVVTFGKMGKRIFKDLKKFRNDDCKYCKSLNDAVDFAASIVSKGDTLLLSPGCASFDEFNNYEERGNFFKQKILSRLNISG